MADRTYSKGFLCRAWGESDCTEAAFESDVKDVERFIVEAQFGDRKLIDELTDLHEENVTMLREQVADMLDALADQQGLWQINFEIGGISVEPALFGAPAHGATARSGEVKAPSPTDADRPA